VSWYEALIDPGQLLPSAQRDPAPPPQVGFALLLEGEFVFYRSLAERLKWPGIGEPPRKGADTSARLLSAVAAHLTAGDEAEDAYRRLTRVRDPEISTIAFLLLSFLYSDTGQLQESIKLLRRALSAHGSPIEQALLRLQLGLRLAEESDPASAIEETELAIKAARRVRPMSWGRALRTIGEHNLFAYEWRRGAATRSPLSLPLRGRSPLLSRSQILYSEGLSKYLTDTFERSLADPYTRTLRFQSMDPVEAPLRGALIRSELLADWNEVRQARSLFGRYLVLSRLGTANGVPAAALELLRRAGDAKAVQAASTTIARMGPLAPLQLVTHALVERADFGAGESSASLRLLAIGADSLDEATVAEAAKRLMSDASYFRAQWAYAPNALAALVAGAPAATQTEASEFVRSLAADESNGALVQGLAPVLSAIRWHDVDPRERARWLDFVQDWFGTPTDSHFLAVRALLGLARTDPGEVEALLRARFATHPDVESLALIFDSLSEPPAWARKSAWPIISEQLRSIRQQASQGSYGMGMIDVANLAVAYLQTDRTNKSGWDELIDFLLDPKVGTSSKTRAIEHLSRPDVRLPKHVRLRLQAGLPTIAAFDEQFGAGPEAFRGAVLKLAARVRSGAADEILVGLLGLAGEPTAVSRMVAAGALVATHPRVGRGVATTLALMLAHDASHDVRGAAARALAELATDEDETISRAQRARLLALLGDPGTVVPLGVLAGLYDAITASLKLDTHLRDRVEALTKQHPSRKVREGAQTVLALADSKGE
jgi:hypothetical protein